MSGFKMKTKQTLLSFRFYLGFYLSYDVLFSKLKPSPFSFQGLFMGCPRTTPIWPADGRRTHVAGGPIKDLSEKLNHFLTRSRYSSHTDDWIVFKQ